MSVNSAIDAYLRVLTGSVGRVVLQAVYFYVLVNALSIADYGVFATVLAVGLIMASGGAFGFSGPLFRAATMKRRLLGYYLGGLYVYALASLPGTILLAVAVHALVLAPYVSLAALLALVVSEVFLWRVIDAVDTVNMGSGRYATGAIASLVGSAARTAAAVAFMAWGDRSLDQWALYYLAGNAVAAALCLALLQPRVRLRWSWTLFRARLPQAYSYGVVNLLQTVHLEADKLLILLLTDQKTVGIYALSMRIIDLAAVPVRSFYPIYVQMLMRRRSLRESLSINLRTEAGIAFTMWAAFEVVILILAYRPNILGPNVAAAYPWFAALAVLAPARALMNYHRELFVAANRVSEFIGIVLILLVVRVPLLALLVATTSDMDRWILPLDALAVVMYAVSAAMTWRLIFGWPARRVPAAA
ncbi:MAG TPA: hypothetical protein VEA41_03435 [Salinarimonas sp.]|nr:hypothetical protein [Salinarimonas sp.]